MKKLILQGLLLVFCLALLVFSFFAPVSSSSKIFSLVTGVLLISYWLFSFKKRRLAVGALLVLVAISGGVYVLLPTRTATWQTYSYLTPSGKQFSFRYPVGWSVKNFYYLGSRFPEQYNDPSERPVGVDIIPPNDNPKDQIKIGIRVSMDPGKCFSYPREDATRCVDDKGLIWTASADPEIQEIFDAIVATYQLEK